MCINYVLVCIENKSRLIYNKFDVDNVIIPNYVFYAMCRMTRDVNSYIKNLKRRIAMNKQDNMNNIEVNFMLNIMKALGWYMNLNKSEIKKKDIAKELHLDAAVISYSTIEPKQADSINANNYADHGKRLISIPRANEFCKCMNTTLENILYYYQFKNVLVNMTKIDMIKKLTNKLTDGEEMSDLILDDYAESIQEQEKDNLHSKSNFISDVNHPDFQSWIGTFYCYFSSTSSDEIDQKCDINLNENKETSEELKELLRCATRDHIFCGIMKVYKDIPKDNLCHVEFKFLANLNNRVIKRYSGILTLSANTRAVFCELISDEQGEKSYLIFEKQDLGKGQPQVDCCMAMALTYSSKVYHRRPCCERMILSSKSFKEGTDEYAAMKAHLRMNDNMIRITQWGYNELIKEINHSEDHELKEIIELFPSLDNLIGQNVTMDKCAFIPESMIRTLHSLSSEQKLKFEVLLRNHSIAPWYSKTKSNKAQTLSNLTNGKQLS